METQSGAKIAIRGKGSVKEGKGKSDAAHASNQDEDLHCLIMADTEEKVNKAKELIHNVIETAASIPEGQNELKRNQLRELAALNGTLRDDENQACQNCGEIGHRKYDCPQQRNFTANIICRVCGNAGHMARDCPDRQRGNFGRDLPPRAPQNAIEGDYEKLMNEIGGGGAPALDTSVPQRQIGYEAGAADANGGARPAAPWQRGPTGAAAPWQQPRQGGGGPAPWENRGGNDGGYGNGGGYGGPTGAPAPWANRGGGAHSGGGGGAHSGGGGGGAAPWQQPPSQPAPWQQPQQAPWQQPSGGYDAVPPPPPADLPPPPPPSDVPPPPPPA